MQVTSSVIWPLDSIGQGLNFLIRSSRVKPRECPMLGNGWKPKAHRGLRVVAKMHLSTELLMRLNQNIAKNMQKPKTFNLQLLWILNSHSYPSFSVFIFRASQFFIPSNQFDQFFVSLAFSSTVEAGDVWDLDAEKQSSDTQQHRWNAMFWEVFRLDEHGVTSTPIL